MNCVSKCSTPPRHQLTSWHLSNVYLLPQCGFEMWSLQRQGGCPSTWIDLSWCKELRLWRMDWTRWTLAFSKRSKPPARRIDFFFSASTKKKIYVFEGPRKATKQELIQSAQNISPTHSWVVKEGTARCSWCLITLKCSEPTSTVHRKFHMHRLCPGGRLQAQRLNELGVHRSHQVDVRPGGIRCAQCKKSRPWMRLAAFQKGCPKEGRRGW